MRCKGIALLSGLLMLAAVALLAVTAAGSMTLQQHQAANFSDDLRAESSTSTAEAWALAWLYSRPAHEREADCVNNCTLPMAVHAPGELPPAPELEGAGWWRNHAVAAATEPATGEAAGFAATNDGEAFWLVEELRYQVVETHEGIDGVGFYRVLARGSGAFPGSVVVSETVVARPWGTALPATEFPSANPPAEYCAAAPAALPCGIMAWRRRR